MFFSELQIGQEFFDYAKEGHWIKVNRIQAECLDNSDPVMIEETAEFDGNEPVTLMAQEHCMRNNLQPII